MRELNERMVKFCEAYVGNGFNGTQAYKDAYTTIDEITKEEKVPSSNVAAVESHRLLADSRIIEKIKDVEGNYRITGHEAGINKKVIMGAIFKMLNATKEIFYNGAQIAEVVDYTSINNAITTYAKLTGDFAPEKKEMKMTDDVSSIDVTKLTPEEREAYKTKILAEM